MSVGRPGEADHVPAGTPRRRTGPGSRRAARNVASTSAVWPDRARRPRRTSASARACTALCWRISSSARWKPNVSACQISCCSSPNACRVAPAAASDCLDQPQVGEEVRGAAVGQVGVPEPGRLQPPGQVEQVGPVRLVRASGPPARPAAPGGPSRPPPGPRRTPRRRRRRARVHGQRAADPGGRVLQRAQHVVGLDDRGLPGHLRGHERVAVPVGADPAAEPQERRDLRRARGRCPAPAARGPSPGRARARPGTASRRTRPSPCGPRRSGHGVDPQLRGAPQQVDLLAQLRGAVLAARSAPRRASSSASTRTLIRRSAAATARRRASVGWAVSTGCTRSPASRSSSWSGALLAADLRHRGGQRLAAGGVRR